MNYMRHCLRHFEPVSAMDATWMKTPKVKAGRGTMLVEATVDANHRIHVIALMDHVGTENKIAYNLFHKLSIEATTLEGSMSPLLLPDRVLIGECVAHRTTLVLHSEP